MLSVLIACLGCRRHCPDSCGGGRSRPVVLDEEGPVVLGGGVVSSPGELAEESLGRDEVAFGAVQLREAQEHVSISEGGRPRPVLTARLLVSIRAVLSPEKLPPSGPARRGGCRWRPEQLVPKVKGFVAGGSSRRSAAEPRKCGRPDPHFQPGTGRPTGRSAQEASMARSWTGSPATGGTWRP